MRSVNAARRAEKHDECSSENFFISPRASFPLSRLRRYARLYCAARTFREIRNAGDRLEHRLRRDQLRDGDCVVRIIRSQFLQSNN